MAQLSEFRSIKRHEVFAVVSLFLTTVAPGFLILQAYFPELVKEMDGFKITVLAVSITLPFLVINSFFVIDANSEISGFRLIGISTLTSFLGFYPSLLSTLFFKLALRDFAVITLILQILCVTLATQLARRMKKRENDNRKEG